MLAADQVSFLCKFKKKKVRTIPKRCNHCVVRYVALMYPYPLSPFFAIFKTTLWLSALTLKEQTSLTVDKGYTLRKVVVSSSEALILPGFFKPLVLLK